MVIAAAASADAGLAVKEALVFLFAAGVIVPLARRFKIPAVVSFLLAGIALGPFGLGRFVDEWAPLEFLTMSDPAGAAPFAELGVLFLLFLLGLELSVDKLWALRRTVFGTGALQTGISALAIGLVAYSFGFSAIPAAAIGLAFALSSTAIVMQVLIEQKRAATTVGRTALGVLLFQDVMVAPILIFVGFAGADATGAALLPAIGEALVQGVAAIAIIILIGRFLLARVFHLAASTGGRDFLMAITLFTIVGAAALTFSAGLSLALGAFMAGLLLGETEFRHQTEVDLEPFKGLLLGLFFMTVGMGIDLVVVAGIWEQVLVWVMVLLVMKTLIAFVAARLFAAPTKPSLEAAFLLAPAGEFAFVIIAAAVAAGLFVPGETVLLSAVAGLSMVLIPAMGSFGASLAGLFSHSDEDVPEVAPTIDDLSELSDHVVIAGFGRVGHVIADILRAEQATVVALERSAPRVAFGRREGWPIFYGDAANEDILKGVGAERASLFMVTVDDPAAAMDMVKAVRRLRPMAPVFVRANDADHAQRLKDAGATFVIPDAIEAGLQMAGRALNEFGYDGETVRDRLAAERGKEYRRADNKGDDEELRVDSAE
ncbi:MAG: cation:proton antiporter [Pseudomonadota bacterium]